MPYHDLFVIVAKHCAGAMKLNHKFLVNAALEIHHSPDGAILFGPSSIGCELIAATSSFRIRCLVSKFRLLGSDAAIYARLRNEVPTWLQKYISVLQKHKKMHNFSGAGGCVFCEVLQASPADQDVLRQVWTMLCSGSSGSSAAVSSGGPILDALVAAKKDWGQRF